MPLFGDDYVSAIYGRRGRALLVLKSIVCRLKTLVSSKGYDALWVEKEMLPWLPAFLELSLMPAGLALIVDYDDAVFHRYDVHRSSIVRELLGRKLDQVMARADLVVAGNDYLAARARAAGAKRVEIVQTVVDLVRYPLLEHQQSEELTIGWIGSPTPPPISTPSSPCLTSCRGRCRYAPLPLERGQTSLRAVVFAPVPWSEESEVGSNYVASTSASCRWRIRPGSVASAVTS